MPARPLISDAPTVIDDGGESPSHGLEEGGLGGPPQPPPVQRREAAFAQDMSHDGVAPPVPSNVGHTVSPHTVSPHPVSPHPVSAQALGHTPTSGTPSALYPPEEGEETTAPRAASAPGAAESLGGRRAQHGVSTITPVGEHPIPPRIPTPRSPEPAGRVRPQTADGTNDNMVVILGLGLGAIGMLALVGLVAFLMSNLFSEPAPSDPALTVRRNPPAPVEPERLPAQAEDDPVTMPIADEPAPDEPVAVVDDEPAVEAPEPSPRDPIITPSPVVLVDVIFKTVPDGVTVSVGGKTTSSLDPVQLEQGKTYAYTLTLEGYEAHTGTVVVNPIEGATIYVPPRGRITLKQIIEAEPEPVATGRVAIMGPKFTDCGLLVDGAPLREDQVRGGTLTIPVIIEALKIGEHRLQVVGADERCADQPEVVWDYRGEPNFNLK